MKSEYSFSVPKGLNTIAGGGTTGRVSSLFTSPNGATQTTQSKNES
jgi:hypothetical protein